MEGFDYWKLLAGLGIFLLGMYLMEDAIRRLSGKAFRRLIRRYTTGRVRSVASGTVATAVLQSSSAVSLMTLAFAGAGIMTLENAIGVVFGSNLGTTVTGWIVATIGFKLDIEKFALPLIGIGGLGTIFFAEKERPLSFSKLLVGFGLLFLGLDYMKTSVGDFTSQFDIARIPAYGAVVYLLIGIVLTAAMQSSSATIAIVLTALHGGIIDFTSAAAMVIGSNIGTTVTIALGSIGGQQIKKRVAISHFVFNLGTAVIALLLLRVLVHFLLDIFGLREDPVMGIALFHTTFNLLGILLFLPFIHVIAGLLMHYFPDKAPRLTLFIQTVPADIPDAALTAMKNEILHLVHEVLRHHLGVLGIDQKLALQSRGYVLLNANGKEKKKLTYDDLKLLQAAIFTYAARIQSHPLSEADAQTLNHYLHSARMALYSAKSLKDVRHNIDEFESTDNTFLNEQHVHFRKRLIETCLDIDRILYETTPEEITAEMLKLFRKLQKRDTNFVEQTVHAVNNNVLRDLDVSTALLVNKALYQSSRQILFTLRELLLNEEQMRHLEQVLDLAEEL